MTADEPVEGRRQMLAFVRDLEGSTLRHQALVIDRGRRWRAAGPLSRRRQGYLTHQGAAVSATLGVVRQLLTLLGEQPLPMNAQDHRQPKRWEQPNRVKP